MPKKNGRVDIVDIELNITFERFRFLVAEGMDISLKKLDIAYTLSTWALREEPTSLNSATNLVGLFKTLKNKCNHLDKARKKGNNAKDLFVRIKNLRNAKPPKKKGASKV